MKSLSVVLILMFVDYSWQDPPPKPGEVGNAVEDCIKSTNVDPSLPEQAFSKGVFVDDPKLKCFIKCMFVKMGDMDDSGKVIIDKLKGQAPPGVNPDQASQIVDTCKDSTGTDPCDSAFQVAKCMVEQSIKTFANVKQ